MIALLGAGAALRDARADSARDRRSVEILVSALGTAPTAQELLKTVVEQIRKEQKLCPTPLVKGAMSASDCIHFVMSGVIDKAYDDGRGSLDRVERTVLKRLFSMVVINNKEEVTTDLKLDPGAGGKGVEQPSIITYRDRKKQFRALRKAKGQTEDLDPEVMKLVEKAYQRKLKGAGKIGSGRIGPEEYLAAQFTRLQLNTLAQLLNELLDRMSHSSGRLVLDRPDYAARAQKVATLEAEVVDLVAQLAQADPQEAAAIQAELQKKNDELKKEREGMKADLLFVKIQQKKGELTQAIEAVLAQGIEPAERAVRAERVDQVNREIQELEKQLDAERDVIELSPSDVDRVAVKALTIEMKRQTARGAFKGIQLEFGDIVMAAWVAGDIDSEMLKACLQMEALGEPRESALKKIGLRALQIGQTVALAYPPLAYGLTLVSIVYGSIEQAKERQKKEADDASVVR